MCMVRQRRPVSERFKAFVKLHRSAIDCLGEDIEDLFDKYFEFECRLGGHVGKAKFIHSTSARSQAEVLLVSRIAHQLLNLTCYQC